MGSSKYPTLSTAKPLLHKLIARTLKENESDTTVMIEVKEKIKHDLQERYQDEDVRRLLNITTFIDPGYKELPSLDANERKSIIEEVEDELLALKGEVSDDMMILMKVNEFNSEDLDQHSNEPTEPATKKRKKNQYRS